MSMTKWISVVAVMASVVTPKAANADGIDSFLFRYDFTFCAKTYSHNGHETEQTAEWSGYMAVNGPAGYGTAVHPCGVGKTTDGDWTIPVCVKTGQIDSGVLLSVGSGCYQQSSYDRAVRLGVIRVVVEHVRVVDVEGEVDVELLVDGPCARLHHSRPLTSSARRYMSKWR